MEPAVDPPARSVPWGAVRREVMARNTEESLTRALGRRAAQVVLVGAMAATPLALGTGLLIAALVASAAIRRVLPPQPSASHPPAVAAQVCPPISSSPCRVERMRIC